MSRTRRVLRLIPEMRPLEVQHSTGSKTVKYMLLMEFKIAGWETGNRSTWQRIFCRPPWS